MAGSREATVHVQASARRPTRTHGRQSSHPGRSQGIKGRYRLRRQRSWTSGQPELPMKALWTRCPREASPVCASGGRGHVQARFATRNRPDSPAMFATWRCRAACPRFRLAQANRGDGVIVRRKKPHHLAVVGPPFRAAWRAASPSRPALPACPCRGRAA